LGYAFNTFYNMISIQKVIWEKLLCLLFWGGGVICLKTTFLSCRKDFLKSVLHAESPAGYKYHINEPFYAVRCNSIPINNIFICTAHKQSLLIIILQVHH
jgi:hypothetical protein